MNKLIIVLLTLLFNVQQANAMNVDLFMDKYIAPVSDTVASWIFYPIKIGSSSVPIIIFWILAAGIFFTLFFRGISIWGLKHAIDVGCKPADKSSDGIGEVSSFQALATALSGTIGIGSIAGDDTIMCAIRSVEETVTVMEKIRKIVLKPAGES